MHKHFLMVYGLLCLNCGSLFAQSYRKEIDIPFTSSGDKLRTLDVYQPIGSATPSPIVIYVHGGGWKEGDKKNTGFKDELFTQNGYLFVSVNYRLSPNPIDLNELNAVRHPIHTQDVAQAITFVKANAIRWNGDPNRVYLIGHSAGAHIVSLISTDERYLAENNESLNSLSCTISLDTAVYDLPFQISNYGPSSIYFNAFGTNPTGWAGASPINYVAPNKSIPSFLLVHQNTNQRTAVTDRFADRLKANGVPTTLLNAQFLNHEQINQFLGAPQASSYNKAVLDFLQNCDL